MRLVDVQVVAWEHYEDANVRCLSEGAVIHLCRPERGKYVAVIAVLKVGEP